MQYKYCTRTYVGIYGADHKEKNIEFPSPLQVRYNIMSYVYVHVANDFFFRECNVRAYMCHHSNIKENSYDSVGGGYVLFSKHAAKHTR